MYKIIQKRKIWIGISSVVLALSITAIAVWGLKFGIDFTGGALLEVKYNENRPAVTDVQSSLQDLELGSLIVQTIDEQGMLLRFQNSSEEKHQAIIEKLSAMAGTKANDGAIEISSSTKEIVLDTSKTKTAAFEELRYESVGPTVGAEMKTKSVNAILIVLIAIVLFIAYAFRQVSKPIASWKYGIAALIALFHDVIIALGAFAVLGKFYGIEVDSSSVAAILTVLGYSVNDTIVVFDRIRENLPRTHGDFEETVNISLNQTMMRSIYTSMTVILVLLAIVFFGGESIKGFAAVLAIGVFAGTYSSIFVASPVMVIWENLRK